MNDEENIFYKPSLHPDRSYRSDAIINDQPIDTTTTTVDDTPTVPDRVTQLLEDFIEIKEVAKLLPGDLPIVLDGPIDPLISQINITYPTGTSEGTLDDIMTDLYDPGIEDQLPDINLIMDSIDDYTYLDASLPSLFPESTDIKIDIVIPKSLADIARDTYAHDSIDLKEDYLKKLQTVMQKYLQEMIMIMSETGVGNITDLTKPYDGTAVTISNKNLQHLGDFIVRSQIGREQKTRLFKKTHNIDQTMMHMRSWHAAEKQRERYYEEKYGDSENYLNTQSNSLLRESRAQYDKKYNQSLYDMYKYLNASVMIVDDTLNMSLKESQAKGTLLKNGVNIYTTQESIEAAKEEAAKAAKAKEDAAKGVTDQATADKAAADKIAADKALAAAKVAIPPDEKVIAAAQAVADKAAIAKTAADKVLADNTAADKLAAAKVMADKAIADQAIVDKAASIKALSSEKSTVDLKKETSSVKDVATSAAKEATNQAMKDATKDIDKLAETALKDFGKNLFK